MVSTAENGKEKWIILLKRCFSLIGNYLRPSNNTRQLPYLKYLGEWSLPMYMTRTRVWTHSPFIAVHANLAQGYKTFSCSTQLSMKLQLFTKN